MIESSQTKGKFKTIHGCAVAVGDQGLLILGVSGAGKSRLIAEMITTWQNPAVRLVADDRVQLSCCNGRLIARPHPLIAGRLEMRGFGIRQVDWLEAVVLGAVVHLVADPPERLPEKTATYFDVLGVQLPCISLLIEASAAVRLRMIWPLLRGKTATK